VGVGVFAPGGVGTIGMNPTGGHGPCPEVKSRGDDNAGVLVSGISQEE